VRGDRYLLDTGGDDPPNNSFNLLIDLETAPSPFTIYSTNELAVSKFLWDIFDTGTEPEPFDRLGMGIGPIWDVMTKYLRGLGGFISVESFWEGWFIRGHVSLPDMVDIAKDRKMDFFEDPFESDNTPNSGRIIPLGIIERHTLYPTGDVDYVAFNATGGQQYTIGTGNLTNGADTFLEVLDTNGVTILGSNDNRNGLQYSAQCTQDCPFNDSTTLSSLINFTAPRSDLFYVRVTRSASAPPSAGRFGSYGLLITSP
jgi:hypothetical protein